MGEWRAFFLTSYICPYCGKKLDACTQADGKDHGPEEGDVSLCINCAGIMVFIDRFTVRQATDKEQRKALEDKSVQRAKQIIERMREQRRKRHGNQHP